MNRRTFRKIAVTLVMAALPAACAHNPAGRSYESSRSPASSPFNADLAARDACKSALGAAENDAKWEHALWNTCLTQGVDPAEVVDNWSAKRDQVLAVCKVNLKQDHRDILFTEKMRGLASADAAGPTRQDTTAAQSRCWTDRERCTRALNVDFPQCP